MNRFGRTLESLEHRVSALQAETHRAAPPDPSLAAALDDLRQSLEALEVAEEELRSQNAELLAARGALDSQRRRYQNLFGMAPDAYITTDTNGTIVEANVAAAELFGVEAHRVVRKPLPLFAAPAYRRPVRRMIASLRNCAIPAVFEFDVLGRDRDAAVAVEARVSADGAGDGRRPHLLWLLRDISARKRAESETRQMAEHLEQMVGERTVALEQTNAELHRANAAKDEFLALVSHELKTPITMIVGFAELLQRHNSALDDTERAGAVDDIRASGQRLARIVDNLLVVARAEHGSLIPTEPVLLQHLLPGLVAELPPFGDHLIDLDLDPALPPVAADATYIERIVVNLLGNAAKYSPEASPIELSASEDEGRVHVTVADRGPGIRADEAERIFSPFYRADATAATPGMGLGLTVCRRLVEAIGGEIHATAREGGGSCFTFSLPALADASAG